MAFIKSRKLENSDVIHYKDMEPSERNTFKEDVLDIFLLVEKTGEKSTSNILTHLILC